MTVDVSWGGVQLAKGASAREQDGGWFVEIEQPMPVGTRLQLGGDLAAEVDVARVHEGLGAGMLLKRAGSAAVGAPPAAVSAPPADVSAPPADVSAAPSAVGTEAEEAPSEKEPEKDNGNGGGGGKKERRKKRR